MKKGGLRCRPPFLHFFLANMSYCGENVAVKYEGRNRFAVSLRCRSWTCPDCQPQRKRQLVAQGLGGAPTTFLTLTSRRRPDKTPNQAALELSRGWRLVRLRLMRKYKLKKLPFLAVIEATEAGWPHIHILLRSRYLDHALISQWMDELCDGKNIWIEKIQNKKKAAGYCAKYCSKCTHKFGTAKRYWQSKDYDLREEHEEKDIKVPGEYWDRSQRNIKTWAAGEEQIYRVIEWISAHKCLSTPADWDPI